MSIASSSIQIKFADNCDCTCDCWPWRRKDDQVYINKHGYAEKFDHEKAIGNENRRSIERLEILLDERLKKHSEEVDRLKTKIQELSDLNFELMKKKDIKLTKSRLTRINDAIGSIFAI